MLDITMLVDILLSYFIAVEDMTTGYAPQFTHVTRAFLTFHPLCNMSFAGGYEKQKPHGLYQLSCRLSSYQCCTGVVTAIIPVLHRDAR